MPTSRLSRADVDRLHTYEWLMARDEAEQAVCETCSAEPGATCRNVHTGRALEWQPAHTARLRSARSSPGSAAARRAFGARDEPQQDAGPGPVQAGPGRAA